MEIGNRMLGKAVLLRGDGFTVEFENGRHGFCRSKDIDVKPPHHTEEKRGYLNRTLEFEVVDTEGRYPIVSRRIIQERESAAAARDLIEDILEDPEQVLEGIVAAVQDYGVFVNLGPLDGLMHRNNILSGVPLKKPFEMFKRGDIVKVKVVEVDQIKNKISLRYEGGK